MHPLICVTFSLPPSVRGWLRLLLVALPGLFCLPFVNLDEAFIKSVRVLAMTMNIFDVRMNGVSIETAVCLQTLHHSDSYRCCRCCQRILKTTVVRCLQNQIRISSVDSHIFRSNMSSGTAEIFLFWGRFIFIVLRAEKNLPCKSNMADVQIVPISFL